MPDAVSRGGQLDRGDTLRRFARYHDDELQAALLYRRPAPVTSRGARG